MPKKGKKIFKAEETLRAGSAGSIKFKLWESNIEHPVSDNRFIGMFEVKGSAMSDGVVAKGADLVCEYEMLGSGNVVLGVTIPSIGASFARSQLYSRQEGQIDFANAAKRIPKRPERRRTRGRHCDVSKRRRLDQARENSAELPPPRG